MNKEREWEGNTESLYFKVEFYHDIKAGNFVAKIITHPLMREYGTGDSFETHRPKELRGNDLDQLRESTKQQIVSLGGRILNLQEQTMQGLGAEGACC